MSTDHLVILAAGVGSRMDPLTRTRPKVMLPVAGRPLVEHLVRRGKGAGFQRVTLVVHAFQEQAQAHFGAGDVFGCRIDYVEQGEPKGTGHAVASLAGRVDGDFVLVSGDSLLSVKDMRALRDATGPTVGGHGVDDARPYGLLAVEDDKVTGVQEKPADKIPGIANAGAYRLDEGIVAACKALKPSLRGELELTDAITAMAEDGRAPALLDLPSWQEAGRPWDLLDLQASLLADLEPRMDGDVGPHVETTGPVVIESGAQVTGHTVIEGPVFIGRDASIGPNAYLRPGTSIGAGCHVGNSCEIKNSILQDGAAVPHLSYVGDSILGEGCNLGAGTQVANLKVNDNPVRIHWQSKEWIDTGRRKLGAILGDGVKTGVNASLNPGFVAAPGATIGAGEAASGWREPRT